MKPQIGFFSELLSSSLIINLTQLISPSVALPAELVSYSDLFLRFLVGCAHHTVSHLPYLVGIVDYTDYTMLHCAQLVYCKLLSIVDHPLVPSPS